MKISLYNVSKSYGKVLAVDQVNLEINDSIFGLIGPNGAGKSTIIRMLCGLLRPDSGTLTIDGLDCWGEAFQIKEQVSFLHETAAYPDGISAMDYLVFVGQVRGMSKNAAKEQAMQLLERVNMEKAADRWIATYSKGMRRLVGVTSSFMGMPKAIVLDEPTANLDPNGRFIVLDLIKQWHEENDTTFFISSHILHELERVSTDVGFLFGGRLVAHDAPSKIMSDLPRGRLILRVTNIEEVFETIRSRYPDMDVSLQGDLIYINDFDQKEASRRINSVLLEYDATLLEFKRDEGSLEHAFKELARRFR